MEDDVKRVMQKRAISSLFQAAGDVESLGHKDFENTILRMARRLRDLANDEKVTAYYEMQSKYYLEA